MIADLLQQVKGHVNILDSVTSGIIPSTLLPLLQEAPCYAEGELEQVAISNCEKLINGVHCDITVKIFTAITEYQLYMPIRYKNIHVIGEKETDLLVKSKFSQTMGL